ncbi:MAG: MBL fold metallo-hydrolase [Deltaproteobacteria bacterium]|nr:MBL fold metallo-hydrolase [Deltaproteobacteria bacterium]
MLIHTSGLIFPGLYLLTLGNSAHYLLESEQECTLFDPGLSVHITPLMMRLEQLHFKPQELSQVFLTHLHPERVGGVPQLRKLNPDLKVFGSAAMKTKLQDPEFKRLIFEEDLRLSAQYPEAPAFKAMDFDEYQDLLFIDKTFPESQTFNFADNLAIRAIFAHGHTSESVLYLVLPHNAIILDESLGYFRGKDMAAPGGDADLEESLKIATTLKDFELNAMCFPNGGLITGALVHKHIEAIIQNTKDLLSQCEIAFKHKISAETIRESVQNSFYANNSPDPLMRTTLDRSFEAVWQQIFSAFGD